MVTKLYIIRHTQTTGNVEKRLTGREDYEVTEEGQQYIERLTNRLKSVKFDKAYASTSGRAIKTIKPLADLNRCTIESTDELCEMYFGIYDGWMWDDVNKVNPKIKEGQNLTNEIMGIPEQESTEEVASRMYACIRKIAMQNLGKTILLGSHGVAIEAFLRRVTGETFLERIADYSQKNTCVNIVEYDSEIDSFKVLLLNDISHLDDLNVKRLNLTDMIKEKEERE